MTLSPECQQPSNSTLIDRESGSAGSPPNAPATSLGRPQGSPNVRVGRFATGLLTLCGKGSHAQRRSWMRPRMPEPRPSRVLKQAVTASWRLDSQERSYRLLRASSWTSRAPRALHQAPQRCPDIPSIPDGRGEWSRDDRVLLHDEHLANRDKGTRCHTNRISPAVDSPAHPGSRSRCVPATLQNHTHVQQVARCLHVDG